MFFRIESRKINDKKNNEQEKGFRKQEQKMGKRCNLSTILPNLNEMGLVNWSKFNKSTCAKSFLEFH